MRVIRIPRQSGARVIALGMFDGVHRGHRTLIRAAGNMAKEKGVPLRVYTFDHHPLEVLRPDNPPDLLSTIPEKAQEMYGLGVDEMEMIHFDRNTAILEPEEFLERLRNTVDICAIVAGWNYSFGSKGRGNAELLKADGKIHGYDVLIVPPATLPDGTVIPFRHPVAGIVVRFLALFVHTSKNHTLTVVALLNTHIKVAVLVE